MGRCRGFISTSEGQPAYLTRSFARSLPTRAEAHSTQAGEQGRFSDINQSASVQWLPDKSTKTKQVWSQAWNSSHWVRVQLNAPCNVAQARAKSLNVAPKERKGEIPGKAPHSSHTAHFTVAWPVATAACTRAGSGHRQSPYGGKKMLQNHVGALCLWHRGGP